MDPLVQKVLKDGVSSLKTDMLPSETRLKLLTQVGDKLFHGNHNVQAAEVYALAGNIQKLRETAQWFLEQKRYGDAALFLKHVGSPEEMKALAEECIARGRYSLAKELYIELGDDAMVQFLDENFS